MFYTIMASKDMKGTLKIANYLKHAFAKKILF